jgi:hypothetical protein
MSESFGIDTNLIETNFVNLAILGAGIFNLGSDFVSKSLAARTQEIVHAFQLACKKSLLVSRLQIRQEKLLYKLVVLEALRDVIFDESVEQLAERVNTRFAGTLRTLLITIDENIGGNVLKSTGTVVSRLWSTSVFIYSAYMLAPLKQN